jgi:hypothetical protein
MGPTFGSPTSCRWCCCSDSSCLSHLKFKSFYEKDITLKNEHWIAGELLISGKALCFRNI